jgi:hypothetical protein
MRCASQRSRSRSRQLDTAKVSLMAFRCRGPRAATRHDREDSTVLNQARPRKHHFSR